jgi:DNA-binding transcriptional LysR family regulator
MDRLTHLQTFVRVVEMGSFAAASEFLGLTPAMVGRQVRALEDHLGAQLLNRTTRRHSLTEAGRIYFERAKAVLEELEAADESVARMRAVPRGLLRVDAPVTFGSTCLAPAMADFLAVFPEIRVELTLNNRIVDLVEEGYDVVFRTGDLPDSGLMARALSPYQLVACAAPSYLEQRGEPTEPGDLEQHACLGFRPGAPNEVWTFLDSEERQSAVRVSGPFSSNNGHTLRMAAIAGAGIILQAEALLLEDIKAGRLVRVLPRMRPKSLPMHVLFPPSRLVVPKLRSFLDFVADRFSSKEHLATLRPSRLG